MHPPHASHMHPMPKHIVEGQKYLLLKHSCIPWKPTLRGLGVFVCGVPDPATQIDISFIFKEIHVVSWAEIPKHADDLKCKNKLTFKVRRQCQNKIQIVLSSVVFKKKFL